MIPKTRSFIAVLGIALLGGAVCAPLVTARTTTTAVDAVSGQVRISRAWVGGHRSTVVESTELADRLRSSGIAWTPDWRTITVRRDNVFGGAISVGCSPAPAIYDLRPMLGEFARASTADDLRRFVGAMRNGPEAERRRSVEAAAERVLNDAEVSRPARV